MKNTNNSRQHWRLRDHDLLGALDGTEQTPEDLLALLEEGAGPVFYPSETDCEDSIWDLYSLHGGCDGRNGETGYGGYLYANVSDGSRRLIHFFRGRFDRHWDSDWGVGATLGIEANDSAGACVVTVLCFEGLMDAMAWVSSLLAPDQLPAQPMAAYRVGLGTGHSCA